MKLSTVIIAKNEEKDVERCLKSIAPISDEVIFVDTGSTDSTKNIAARYTSRIFDFEWIDDFSAVRNFALDKAAGDIILSMDADECLSQKDWPKLEEIKSRQAGDLLWGFSLPVRNYVKEVMDYNFFPCGGEYEEMEKDYFGYILNFRILIFPNNQNIRFQNIIHESVEKSIAKNGGDIIKVDIPVHNFGYNKHDPEKKRSYYEKLLLIELQKNSDDFKKNYDYAHFLLSEKKEKEALPFMEKAYELSGRSKGRIAYFLGVLYYVLEDFLSAKEIFKDLMDTNQPGVYYYLSLAESLQGHQEESVQYVRKGLRQFKDNPFLLKLATELYLKEGNLKLAEKYKEKLKQSMKRKTVG